MAHIHAHTTHAGDTPAPSRAEPRGHGLRLRSWDPDDDADAEAWLRGILDPEFQRWNTPLTLWTDLAGARESLRARAREAADGRAVSFRVTDDGIGTAGPRGTTGSATAASGTAGRGPTGRGTTLGHVGVNEISLTMKVARVGYWVLPEARGRGVAGRALLLASRWAFAELGLHRLELGHAVGHEVSCRVAERCGYRAEGTLRGAMFESGRHDAFRDVHLHARLSTDTEPATPDAR
ncbi:GNAT family N-acetyltransferase [Streptomyces sp. NPDC057245]|uniref:GNAT family N-acetyltransferase n=1 Tax=Streptomyces TaxID=1883 RepID=UPI001C1DD3EF|nr:GNAT family N-acetyltransferase [Streptomyces sp. A108]MBU6534368.1 GNAT N-acetyltransferase [Streptomyces sp. A108]